MYIIYLFRRGNSVVTFWEIVVPRFTCAPTASSIVVIMSPHSGVGEILFICPSVCHKLSLLCKFKPILMEHDMSRHADHKKRISGLLIVRVRPFKMVNSRFCDLVVSTVQLHVQNRLRYYFEFKLDY